VARTLKRAQVRRALTPQCFRYSLLRRAYEQADVLDPDLTIVVANEAYLATTMTARSAIVGRGLFDVFPDNPDNPAASGVANLRASLDIVRSELAANTMAVLQYDIRRPESDGGGFEARYWSSINCPVLSSDGRLAYIIHRVEDVTEFVRLRMHESEQKEIAEVLERRTAQMEVEIYRRSRDLEDANRQLRIVNDEKSNFLSRVSHELRTPLHAVLGFAQILEEDDLQAEQLAAVAQILKAGEHLLALIDEILDISRAETGDLALSLEPVLVGELAQEALDLMQPLAEQRSIRLVGDAGTIGRHHVLADRQRLKQILLNLLSNAVKYNHEGGVVTLSCELPQSARLRVNVMDTGPGVDDRQRVRLFTPFERAGAESTDVQGTGLGLALSRTLARAMSGSLDFESTVGQGSTFWVELPVVAVPDDPMSPA